MQKLNQNEMGEAAIVNRGNLYRLKKVMNRANEGESLVLGFLGGSITQGSLATKPELCYAALVASWWKRRFPKASFTYVNAGVGGTTSHFGVARVEEDLLTKKPDFVVVEFSVNDEANEHFKETYECLIRRILTMEDPPAILLLHNMFYNDGHSAQKEHVEVGTYYELPCISILDSVYPHIVNGKIMRREITPDDLHPNDAGHQFICDMVTYFLEKVANECTQEEVGVTGLKPPITQNHFAITKRYQNYNCNPEGEGFVADSKPKIAVYDNFKRGWYTRQEGARLVFHVTGTELAIQYRKTIHRPAPIAIAILDGDEEHAVTLDANFDEDWGDCLYLEEIGTNLKEREHTVEIRVVHTTKEDCSDFYLVSLISGEC